jgi:two-component system sensor histidine kinase RegB
MIPSVLPAPLAGGVAPSPTRADVSLPWLVRLRWGVVAADVLTVVVGAVTLGPAMPWAPALAPIAVAVALNAWLARRPDRAGPPWLCGMVLALDTLLLTLLLHATGGPMNPFSVLYLVHVTLAAVVLGARWTWLLAALSVAGYGALFALPGAEAAHASHLVGGAMALHLQTMLLAFAVAAALTAYVVVQLSAAIDRRDAELAAMRAEAARTERLASLTTLAAGAAHELATPLGTIAIAAAELERALGAAVADDALRDDARLIRAEVRRCRGILDRLASDAGTARGEVPAATPATALVADARAALGADAARIRITVAPPDAVVRVPRHAVVRALVSVLRNALDASAAGAPVALDVEARGDVVRLVVRDRGAGMPPEVLARAGEPFFTTKAPGRGMGLGLFLARTLCERLGGRVVVTSTAGAGSTVSLELPAAAGPAPATEARGAA